LDFQVCSFFVGELKTELSWEPIGIAPGCLVEPFGENSVEPREIAIKNDLGFSDSVDWEQSKAGVDIKGNVLGSLPLPRATNQPEVFRLTAISATRSVEGGF